MQERAGWGRASLRAERASGDRWVVSCTGDGGRLALGAGPRRRARLSVISTLVVFAVWLVTAAGASAFTARGSVNQVYATGLPANAQASLLNPCGATVDGLNADS